MIQSLFEWMFKQYINKLVDQRFKENTIERYTQQQQIDRRRRIAKLRETLDNKTSRVPKNTQTQLQSSSDVQSIPLEPKLQKAPDSAVLKKQQEMASIKAKLLGKKK